MERVLRIRSQVFWSEYFFPSLGFSFLIFQMIGLEEVVSKMVMTF